MPTDGNVLITDTGHDKINGALASASAVEITHVALGDGNGFNYDPSNNQRYLRREMSRVPITKRHLGGDNVWVVKAEFIADDTPTFVVREIGFIDADGDLIFVWAGLNVAPRQTGAIDYLIEHALNLDRIKEGVVIVSAPDDEVFDLATATATAILDLQLQQLKQDKDIADLKRNNGA